MKSRSASFILLAALSSLAAGSFCSTRDEFDCVYINEICWSNTKVEDGAGNFKSDWVELYNPRGHTVDVGGYAIGLKGTWLESEADGKLFVLPSYKMKPGSFLLVFFNKDYTAADTGLDASKAIIRSNAFNLGKNGDKTQQDSVRLFAPTEHTRVSNFKDVPVLADDTSYGWVHDGSFDLYGRQNVSLKVFSNPTPGASNYGGNNPVVPDPTLKINEVCYSNSTIDDGMGDDNCDFVELYNPGPDAVNLGGMKLGKKATVADCGDAVFQFPDYLLEPGEFFVVFFDKGAEPKTETVTRTVNGVAKSVPLIRSNSLSFGTGYSVEVPGSEGTNVVVQDSVRLFAANGRRIDNFKGEDVAAALGVVLNGVTGEWEGLVEKEASVGYVQDANPDSGLSEFLLPTPWAPNCGGIADRLPPLKINEVCYSNSRLDDGMGCLGSDFVEIYNPGPSAVGLGGMKLGKKATVVDCGTSVFVFPDYQLDPGEFFVVYFNKDVEPSSSTVKRIVGGVEKNVPLIRSNALSLGKGESTEVPGSEGTNVVVQDSVRLFAADGRRIDNFKGDDVAVAVGVAMNPDTGLWEGLVEDDASVGPKTDGGSDLSEFFQPTPWGPNSSGTDRPTLVVINEVCYSNSKLDDGTGNKDCDFVELYNPGPDAVNLGGMKLGKKGTLEKCGTAVFPLPDYRLEPNEFFVVFFNKDVPPVTNTVKRTVNGVEKDVPLIRSNVLSLGKGESTEVPGYEGSNVVVQDSVRLFAADGRRIDNFKGEDVAAVAGVRRNSSGGFEALLEDDTSVGRRVDGDDELAILYTPNPWEPNAGGIARQAVVVINEVCWSCLTPSEGLTNDFVELYNPGPQSVNIGGMKIGLKSTLEKCLEDGECFTLPDYEMESNEFFVVYFTKNDTVIDSTVRRIVNGREKTVPLIRTNVFSLGTDTSVEVPGYEGRSVKVQVSVRLFDKNGERVSNYKGEDVAEALVVFNDGYTLRATLEDDQTFGYLWDGNLLPNGAKPDASQSGRFVLNRLTPWGPNGAGYTFAAPGVTGSVPGRYTTVQNITFTTEPDTTIRYTTDGSDPLVSPTAVECSAGDMVTIDAAESATVASGGSLTNAWIRTSPVELATKEPNAAWRAPIGSVSRASVLRAVAVKGPACSAEYRGTWYIGMPFLYQQTLPSVSIIANEADLFSDEKGIYVPGTIYKTNGYGSNKWGKPNANYYGDGEVAAHVELIEPAESEAPQSLVLDAGLAINGGGTRSLPQKALYVKMKSAYGAKNFTYDLIPSVGERTYRRFLLRPDGNDWYGPYTDGVSTMMKDAVFHRIVSGLDMFTMAYRPAVVYVNGSYWGIHNIRESVDKQAFATRYGLDEDLIDVLTHEDAGSSNVSISLIDGAEKAVADYRDWLSSLQSRDISSAADYQSYVTAKMDVTNYIDYIVTECFYANTDWPINNCDFWRSSTDQTATAGKYGDRRWRWALYDLDLAGLVVDGVGGVNRNMLTYLSGSNMTGVKEPGFLINRLWSNATFKDEFIRRYTELLNTTFRPERTSAIISAAADEIDDEIEMHYRRWGRSFSKSDWQKAVGDALVSYTAQRWTNSFVHASAKFSLGGVGEVRVMNDDPSGVGGHFVVDGTVIETSTDGVADRADWTGRYYPGRPVTIVAVPDAGYVFDSWVGSAETSASRTVTVTAGGLVQFKARFRPSSAPAPLALGFASWQDANCDEQAVLRGEAGVLPGAVAVSKGGRDYTNFELFAFGVTKAEALSMSEGELKARTSLRISSGSGMALEYGCSPYGGVDTRVKVAESLASGAWRTAETGTDVGPAETNRSSRDGWTVSVPLLTNRGEDFYQLEIEGDGR